MLLSSILIFNNNDNRKVSGAQNLRKIKSKIRKSKLKFRTNLAINGLILSGGGVRKLALRGGDGPLRGGDGALRGDDGALAGDLPDLNVWKTGRPNELSFGSFSFPRQPL